MAFGRSGQQKRSRLPSPLQITPMIDVIFLLLIFFLLSTSYSPPESELIPSLQSEQVEGGSSADFQPQIVEVDFFGGQPGFRIAGRVLRSKAELRDLLAELPREGGVFVEGADRVSVRWATAALQACRDAGYEKVTYVPKRST